MPVTYDKQRKQWKARFTYDGQRIFVGRYPTKKIAEVALEVHKKKLEKLHSLNVETYQLKFEQTDQSLVRKMVNRIRKLRREREQDKQTKEKLEAL